MSNKTGLYKGVTRSIADRLCPKCGNQEAFGPEFTYGRDWEPVIGECLKYRCTVCGLVSFDPTRDQDTPERRQALKDLVSEGRKRIEQRMVDGKQVPSYVKDDSRDRDIEAVRRAEMRGRRQSYGWEK